MLCLYNIFQPYACMGLDYVNLTAMICGILSLYCTNVFRVLARRKQNSAIFNEVGKFGWPVKLSPSKSHFLTRADEQDWAC
jgi:hypothetical protein